MIFLKNNFLFFLERFFRYNKHQTYAKQNADPYL